MTEPPRVIVSEKVKVARLGDVVDLECHSEGFPPPLVMWERRNTKDGRLCTMIVRIIFIINVFEQVTTGAIQMS